ncbi:GAF and ANTAR domain-containing protein [Actinophytocola oryzae]|uniref:GAF domain-containing protein n=1 Tax=Actinophytocola oryzae TaxID=502181 RepID=A0A4R7V338_9PSEU|nr:GAF and ANTAR domain-containing protein [Actinophytocola oryzae]TDV43094.1 GAF domain-containing protein [Actinophytocola oryzae]
MQDDWSRDRAAFVAEPADGPHPADGDEIRSPLAAQFATLTRALLRTGSVADVLDVVVQATHAVIPTADLVSLTVRTPDGKLHTPLETDPLGTELDELQYEFDEGPCLEAAREEGIAYTHSGDLAASPDWPRFGPAAADRGYVSVLSTALVSSDQPPRLRGAMNIYSREPGALGDEMTRDHALLLATHASLALAHTEAVRLAELRETQLRRALESRDVIGQAKGILMNRRGIDADEAFDLLRRTSQDLNVRLAQLADTLASRHTELGLPDR